MEFPVYTINKRVYDIMLRLRKQFPNAFEQMLDHLTKEPFENIPRKYFKLVQYHAWEYKLPSFNRIYSKLYLFNGQQRVIIYHAGDHPNDGVPQPPDDNDIDWSNVQII